VARIQRKAKQHSLLAWKSNTEEKGSLDSGRVANWPYPGCRKWRRDVLSIREQMLSIGAIFSILIKPLRYREESTKKSPFWAVASLTL